MKKKHLFNCKIYFIVFMLCLFNGCDFQYSARLNEHSKLYLYCNGNKIEMKAKALRGTQFIISMKPMSGNFDFYSDSINIIINPLSEWEVDYQFKYDNKIFSGYQIVEKNKTLICYFSIYGKFVDPVPKEILIPPSSFIMCNGEPLVTDTIRLSKKNASF